MTVRRTLAATAAVCAVLAGCGQNQEPTTTGATSALPTTPVTATTSTAATSEPTPSAETTFSATATRSATSSPTPDSTVVTNSLAPKDRKTPAGGNAGSTVPEKSPEDYGDAAVNAWARGDHATVAKYVSRNARAQASSTPPAGELLRVACDGDMCSYTTEDGKRVTLTFDLATVKAGKTGGITGIKIS